jgi:maltose alpha-D-glucosyltransferase/alpha-amylase
VEGSEPAEALDRAAAGWAGWVGAAFTAEYREVAGPELLPGDIAGSATLLQAFLVDKVAYEVTYEINSRPDWVFLPLRGLLELARG